MLIGVVSSKKHACKVTSYLQFVKGLVGVWVLQLFELEKLERSPRHFQLPPPSVSVYLRIVLFISDVITLLLCTAGPALGPALGMALCVLGRRSMDTPSAST